MLMDFKVFEMSEDKDMHRKKVYDNAPHCADTVEYTDRVSARNDATASDKCLDSESTENETNMTKVTHLMREKLGQMLKKLLA